MADTQRDQAERNSAEPELKPTRTKVLHAGRPEVEREVPVVDKLPTFKNRHKVSTQRSRIGIWPAHPLRSRQPRW